MGYRKNQPAKNFWFTPGNRTGKMETLQQGFERLVENELGLDKNIIQFEKSIDGVTNRFVRMQCAEYTHNHTVDLF